MGLAKNITIKNRKARFNYEVMDRFTAGIVLRGTEIKSLRSGQASIAESFCEFSNNELFVINMTIQEYSHATHYNHQAKSSRKLLLQRRELNKLFKAVKNTGLTIIPMVLYINDQGLAKMEIALCRGKKLFDKREVLKERDNKRDISRIKKIHNT
ncbi:MAG: SsrA-binding protein SmpB [Flavobacteriaceae bacterium]|jgi:SsrA-binding protein|nr:SsrA-binding protein SmpB [Flavobacteriaceae bacterium]MDG1961776.1 SsrA-binding protein SmpB [Flavobacteriaceae bacterium]